MNGRISPLFSKYILDGTIMDETPFSALLDVLDGNGTVEIPKETFSDIVDEYMDKPPYAVAYDLSKADFYCQSILRQSFDRKAVNLDFPVSWTISSIDFVLLETLFRKGHFTLGDIMLMIRWDWNNAPAGNLAAFYDSTVTAGHYLFDLGLKLDRYFVEENRKGCFMDVSVASRLTSGRSCPDTMQRQFDDSALIYIPFSQSKYNLGGSALSSLGGGSGAEADLYDPDYFIDCYEVVREMVEDGVILAGSTVSRGGLMTAVEKFRGRCGVSINTDGLASALGEGDMMKLLFAEIPGVLLQIARSDMEYVDSQFLLQEIAYYPVGRMAPGTSSVSLEQTKRDALASILSTLLQQSGGDDIEDGQNS